MRQPAPGSAALDTQYGADAGAFDSYSNEADMADISTRKTLSGHPVTLYNMGQGNYHIFDGALVHPLSAEGATTAAYLGVTLRRRVREMWVDVSWADDGHAGDELAVMVISATRFTQHPYPNAGSHILFGRSSWSYQTFISGNPVNKASGTYGKIPFGVRHRFGVRVEGSTATVYLPDGSTHTLTDAQIADWEGPHATVESFAATYANSIHIHAWGASSALSAARPKR